MRTASRRDRKGRLVLEQPVSSPPCSHDTETLSVVFYGCRINCNNLHSLKPHALSHSFPGVGVPAGLGWVF